MKEKVSELKHDTIEVYSDGACSPNPGKGGYGYVIRFFNPIAGSIHPDELTIEGSGGYIDTTNNRMELMGCLQGLHRAIELLYQYSHFIFRDEDSYKIWMERFPTDYPEHTILTNRVTKVNGSNVRAITISLPFRGLKVVSDSSYLCRGFGSGWVKKWKLNKWLTSTGSSVKNVDLWESIDRCLAQLRQEYGLKWHFVCVPGHRGHKFNEICDKLAVAARKGELEMDDSPPSYDEGEH